MVIDKYHHVIREKGTVKKRLNYPVFKAELKRRGI
jgi:hypothetical protein